jgi:hypothetical protein
LRFADVGGIENLKQQISELVKSQLNCKKYKRYGVVKNGILLHGPQGGGKSHLAEATAGEFGLRFYRVSPLKLVDQKIGATAENIRYEFAKAAANTPSLLFFDELDALGTASPTGGDPGGGGRELNNAVIQLMECVAEYEFALNSDGGGCDDPILWFFLCLQLAGINGELEAPRCGTGCGGNTGGGVDFCATRAGTRQFACCNSGSAEHHKWCDPNRAQLNQFRKNRD